MLPSSPDHPNEALHPLPQKAATLWMVFPIVLAAILAILGIVGLIIARSAASPSTGGTIAALAAIVVAIGVGVGGVAWARATWRNWSYSLSDQWITIRHGVVTKRKVVVPRNRVQTVVTTTGPLDQLLGLTTLTIHTAGIGSPNISIPHLDDAAARHIQQELRNDQGPTA